MSSGILHNVPNAGYPRRASYDLNDNSPNRYQPIGQSAPINDFVLYSNPMINYDLIHNLSVGYSVIEKYENGKRIIYDYTNEECLNEQTRSVSGFEYEKHCLAEYLYHNSSLGSNIYIDNSHLRGKLKRKRIYDENNNLLMKIENNYRSFSSRGEDDSDFNEFQYTKLFLLDERVYEGSKLVMNSKKSYNPIFNNISSKEVTMFYEGGSVQSKILYDFDLYQNLKSKRVYNSNDGFAYESRYYKYPYDYDVNDVENESPIGSLLENNRISVPLSTIVKYTKDNSNTYIKSASKTVFKRNQTTNDELNLAKIQSLNLYNNEYSDEVIFDYYDVQGNLLQYTTKGDIPTAIVYGYHTTQPIAQIVGATYAQVEGLISTIVNKSDLDTDANTEQQLIDALDEFRKLPALKDYQITTYTYDPLIGVTSITPPSGIRQVYLYDEANRLKEVREDSATGELLKAHEYHYKP